MHNFVMFFDEKEGTTALVSLMSRFPELSVVQLENNGGLEPFDAHACGPMSLHDLENCLDLVFASGGADMTELNRIYSKTSERRVGAIGTGQSVGFKMRYRSPWPDRRRLASMGGLRRRLTKTAIAYQQFAFSRMMRRVLKRHEVVVLLAVRQDVLRWALSKYHGDGTGNPGHLQFKLANGTIRHEDIGKIRVDCNELAGIINHCRKVHASKRRIQRQLERAGIPVHVVRYESFLSDQIATLEAIFGALELHVSNARIAEIAAQKTKFVKVHSDDISDFVENHEEVTSRFGDQFVEWA